MSKLPVDLELIRDTTTARGAAFLTLAGAGAILLGSSSPWLLSAVVGVTVETTRLPDVAFALVALALLSALIATAVLLRRPARPAVALGLIAFALAELCLAVWNAVSVLQAIAADDPLLVMGRAIGTGAYMCVIGAAVVLAGSVLAWRRRASSPAIVVNLQ